MAVGRKGNGLVRLVPAKKACCGALLPTAGGAFSLDENGGWLLDREIVWSAIGLLLMANLHPWRQQGWGSTDKNDKNNED